MKRKIKVGDRVRNSVLVQSDDRENGIDDGSPIVAPNTEGVVVGLSKDFLNDPLEDHRKIILKDENCLLVDWDGTLFDMREDELEKI